MLKASAQMKARNTVLHVLVKEAAETYLLISDAARSKNIGAYLRHHFLPLPYPPLQV